MNITNTFVKPLNGDTINMFECKNLCVNQCKPFIYSDLINNYMWLIFIALILLFLAYATLRYKSVLMIALASKGNPISDERYLSGVITFIVVSIFLLLAFILLFQFGFRITDVINI